MCPSNVNCRKTASPSSKQADGITTEDVRTKYHCPYRNTIYIPPVCITDLLFSLTVYRLWVIDTSTLALHVDEPITGFGLSNRPGAIIPSLRVSHS